MIKEHLDKDNLHHAYLIEGDKNNIVPEILKFCRDLNIKISGNPDFCQITIDNFKIDEAFNLRAMSTDKSFTSEKKIFVICVNSFSLDAQNVLLKMFEEPIENTHFFLVAPDANSLLKTLVSRFYVIPARQDLAMEDLAMERQEAEKFISMPLQKRIDFIKELLIETEEQDAEGNEIVALDSTRSKALKFLNILEAVLHSKFVKNFSGLTLLGVPSGTHIVQNSLQICLQHFFKVREFLRMPGSSVKTLMESVALIVPNL
ncbi:hypothetical protein A2641_03190 [Candidatus Nomurabacteria bacterium RIFCSPHIGHO2_01_FULL_37_25]|uniref:DNA polymerase III subunit delta n=1 Tax=Candidatus Nomurabacteria bacterium RIFCSPLOWO2_01_FULL_36_16 TaxID=1801767 RepID=A0A1F6WZQ1_9BACT|nr:MAG: hypothetical protein A2641_03190 [Candidatus Nomurabacteria bacterium RIFCSPHIGHO2_01_FULL_37_25]OGI75494.1 MAG: hypothetical protein A3D36_02835 [Candidatus Nomurabacteria bacterium RIFCSPHIGHO2_02_FULL_36_29]OGI87332.1 MAG: hypothetical protein A3A91_02455 [Candidatus Nomurabacteria bacterium RIFCSPLOWO2_01_FULL_36_16]OGI94881.1 MAG: hypothetical protein A3I84_00515 [Candidatus Nomurabacteria bacterium RIFCSPLOWO2_02_FULL_36_8]